MAQRAAVDGIAAEAPSWDLGGKWNASCALAATCTTSWTDDDDDDGGAEHFDLGDNPEQYTGYAAGAGASRIWHELHRHNSFRSAEHSGVEEAPGSLGKMPVEHRLFYRLLSGLHASVSSHISANYLLDGNSNTWGLELDEYQRRLADNPERLHNLHFAYLTVLRAVELASSHLSLSFSFSTGMPREDASVARDVRALLSSQPEWPLTFDEQLAFAGVRCPSGVAAPAEPSLQPSCGVDDVATRTEVLHSFRLRLHNISRLMDCVGCGRCRLWGKLQVQGLGTALRILYAPDRQATLESLERSHVVALFNLLGRLSHSVEVARNVAPLLGGVHASCSRRGCAASAYEVDNGPDEEEEEAPRDPFTGELL